MKKYGREVFADRCCRPGRGSKGPGVCSIDTGTQSAGAPSGVNRLPAVLLLSALVLFGLSACRTLPSQPYPEILSSLPPESTVIVRARVPGNEELVEFFYRRVVPESLKNGDWERIRQRTALVALGLEWQPDMSPDAPIPFHLSAIGNWPRAWMGVILGNDWKKNRERPFSWTGPENLELSVIAENQILLSSGRTSQILSNAGSVKKPESYFDPQWLLADSDFAFILTDPAIVAETVPFLGNTDSSGKPLVDWIAGTLNSDGSVYNMRITIKPEDPSFAATMTFLIRLGLSTNLGLSSSTRDQNLLSQLSVEARNGEVRINAGSLRIEDIAGFLEVTG